MNDKHDKSKNLSEGEYNKLMDKFSGMSEKDSIEYQLNQWLNGISLHNPIRDECCPDFSCCNGGNMLSLKMREEFFDAFRADDAEKQWGILSMCLSMLIADTDKDVYIAGDSKTIH